MKKLKWFVIGYTVAQIGTWWSYRVATKMGIVSIETDPDVTRPKLDAYVQQMTEKWGKKAIPYLDRI